MQFDEFVAGHGIAVSPVDRFDGLVVDVGVPRDWKPFDSAVGIGVWVCRSDPRMNDFCTNAVLTLHRVEASLDAGAVFAMLSEQQLQSVPGCHELYRELTTATEGPGDAGVLAMQIAHEPGSLDSVSRSRIITNEQQTLIAQLTVTALHDSPVDRKNIWLSIRTDTAGQRPSSDRGGTPVGRTQGGS
ncbi:hypothetical protein BST28_21240 [Mycolicibacter kumamotonensis]|uniref:Uncharacterized protein n=1 Tax=Mycolicibacter kumamotonensis TaxID=354243 RepID=A0A1X0DUS5_9MYCO|nr:LpqN/LpqT family lipoprotein [Mycolicibacter kumamotonensis]ORA76116.1 hypothetical protein BST28_21240 [Mycolicibacter kumamotonensis]